MTLRFAFVALLSISTANAQVECVCQKVTSAPSFGMPYASEVRISADGRFVAFSSLADTLVPGDTNGLRDVFVFDRETQQTECVSRGPAGVDPNGASYDPAISSDGRFVVFTSNASNLVAGDVENNPDVFLRDRSAGTIRRISQAADGVGGSGPSEEPDITPGGTFVVFASRANNFGDPNFFARYNIYLYDRVADQLQQLTTGLGGASVDGDSNNPSISADGRRVAFHSDATNLGPADGNSRADVYVLDRPTSTFTRASVSPAGDSNNHSGEASLSADGRVVAFWSYASNLIASDLNAVVDVFAYDLTTGMTELISATPAGFAANAESFIPSISSNGRFVAFESLANDIVPGLPSPQLRQRIFVRDRWTQQTALWSVNVDGTAPMQDSYRCAISADGASVAFASRANNLVLPADPDSLLDIFVRTCPFETPTTYCMAAANSLGCTPQIGATGTPSASSTVPFDVSAILVLNRRAGLLFYSTHGSEMLPLGGGFLCVRPPTMRCAMQVSDGSSAGTDCSGSYHFDFNARIHSGVDPALGVGSDVWAQYWSRDPAAPSTTSLSDALEFHIDL